MRDRKRQFICYLILTVLLCFFLALNLIGGTVKLSAGELMAILRSGDDGSSNARIIWEIRLPRLLAAAILGGGLAVSGLMLQTFFANPIAGPFVLGISSGAKLVVAFTMIGAMSRGVSLTSGAIVTAAFCGSLFCMGLILALSGRVRRMGVLIICGVMIGYICSAITELAVTFAEDNNIVNLHNWSMGSFSGTGWEDVGTMTAIVAVCMILALPLTKPMGAYQLGESSAVNMGVNVRRFRAALILLSSLLSACVTAFAGPISFVGVAAPHIVKSMLGTSKPLVVLPACFLGGSVFCLGCDYIARTMFAPSDLSISSVTAVFGAPVVIWLMVKRGKRYD